MGQVRPVLPVEALRGTRLVPVPENVDSLPGLAGTLELGHFDLISVIGRGGYGLVVKALDRRLQRTVAIKMMSERSLASPADRKRFVREARSMAVVRHENVTHIYSVDEAPVPYLVMEYVSGGTLQHLLENGPLEVGEAVRLAAQIARGLDAIHRHGLVHRDLKPANVLLDGDPPQVRVTDFGLALSADDPHLTDTGYIVGTPLYMAPEQARGEVIDARADLYSLGGILYAMLTGKPPLTASNATAVLHRLATDVPQPPREIRPEMPVWLSDLTALLLAKNPVSRIQTAAEVAEILERGAFVRPPPTWRGRSPVWRKVAAAVGAMAATALVCWATLPRGGTTLPTPDAVAGTATASALTPPGNATPPGEKQRPGLPPTFTNRFGIEFRLIPEGKSQERWRDSKIRTREFHAPKPFYFGTYEITQGQWTRVMGPADTRGLLSRNGPRRDLVEKVPDAELDRLPATGLSWNDCREFIGELNRLAYEPGWVYRLPTAGEWNYVCQGGPNVPASELGHEFYLDTGPSDTLPESRARFGKKFEDLPLPVGSFPPNRLGVYDMHGNVFEYLHDDIPATKGLRAYIGGYWAGKDADCSMTRRVAGEPQKRYTGNGFRVVKVPVEPITTSVAISSPSPTSSTKSEFDTFVAEFRRANPKFEDEVVPEYRDDKLVGIRVLRGTHIQSLEPVRALRHLERIDLPESEFGDLTPLEGLPLREIYFNSNSKISDLTPLRGKKLQVLFLWCFGGTDLSPLKGMPLHTFNAGQSRVADLSPLQGMPLKYICMNGCRSLEDLSPLKGLPLETLMVEHTKVSDLSPLEGAKLKLLAVRGSKVTDLSPIRDMPLTFLTLDFDAARDTSLLKSLSKLEEINKMPAADFWKKAEKK